MTVHTHVHHKTWLMLSLTLGLVFYCFASWRAGVHEAQPSLHNHPSQSSEQAGKGRALAGVLNADGAVKSGLAGSFDVSGYRMESTATGAATLGSVFGLLYDDAEAGVSFSLAAGVCQWRSVLSGNAIRTVPRYEQFIPAGRTGWLKVAATNLGALTGAVLNFNASAAVQGGAFNQGHNLHKLTTTNMAALTMPVFPPGC